jgi:hypothetical protein
MVLLKSRKKMKTKNALALLIGVPLAVWIGGVCLDAAKITGNLTTPLTKGVLDLWFLVAVYFGFVWLTKKKPKA